MGVFYHKGPDHSPDEALPSFPIRVKAFYADGHSEAAICDQGKWWAFYAKAAVPMKWHHMEDHRMSIGEQTATYCSNQ